MEYSEDDPLSYALSPVVKTVPAIVSNKLAVASSPELEQLAMSPAPTNTGSDPGIVVADGMKDEVGVDVGRETGVMVAVEIGRDVEVDVDRTSGVTVAVGIDVGPTPFTVTIRYGEFAPVSREDKLMDVDPGVINPKLYVFALTTYDVTSSSIQVPPVTDGTDDSVFPIAGALL